GRCRNEDCQSHFHARLSNPVVTQGLALGQSARRLLEFGARDGFGSKGEIERRRGAPLLLVQPRVANQSGSEIQPFRAERARLDLQGALVEGGGALLFPAVQQLVRKEDETIRYFR